MKQAVSLVCMYTMFKWSYVRLLSSVKNKLLYKYKNFMYLYKRKLCYLLHTFLPQTCAGKTSLHWKKDSCTLLMSYRGFHEKGTHSYLCPQGQIVSIEQVYTPSTFYMKSAVSHNPRTLFLLNSPSSKGTHIKKKNQWSDH